MTPVYEREQKWCSRVSREKLIASQEYSAENSGDIERRLDWKWSKMGKRDKNAANGKEQREREQRERNAVWEAERYQPGKRNKKKCSGHKEPTDIEHGCIGEDEVSD